MWRVFQEIEKRFQNSPHFSPLYTTVQGALTDFHVIMVMIMCTLSSVSFNCLL